MAGINCGIGCMAVDLYDRRLNLGRATTGIDGASNELTVKDMTADEMRLGVQFEHSLTANMAPASAPARQPPRRFQSPPVARQ